MRKYALFGLLFSVIAVAATSGRPLRLEDLGRIQQVASPRLSPDGKWIAYTLTSVDTAADKQVTDIWMVSWDGVQDIRLTYSTADGSATSPRWSPDGRYLTFLSSRPGRNIAAAAKPSS